MKEAQKLNVDIKIKHSIIDIKKSDEHFILTLATSEELRCDSLVIATGSHPQGHLFAKQFGHTIQEPVPSLFTFNVPSSPLKDLAGISVPNVEISIRNTSLIQQGPLLITHWGFSGPAALKLSAWGARLLHEKNYHVELCIKWITDYSQEQAMEALIAWRKQHPSQNIDAHHPFSLPKNLWKRFLELCGIQEKRRFSDVSNETFKQIALRLTADIYSTEGKTTNKEEFVTCGGVALDEINFKTMESRLCHGLYFVGEILDVDGVTGGFNFQNAWTGGWLAGNSALQHVFKKKNESTTPQ